MARLEKSKYDVMNREIKKDTYEGKILVRSLSSRVLKSPKATSFLAYVEDILYNWYDTVRIIKKSINFRSKLDDKNIDK
jgi:hypothetical protein